MSDTNANYDLAGSFARISLLIQIVLMLFFGWWINHTIQKQVIDNTAINAALYAQSFITPDLQNLSHRTHLTDEEISRLEYLLTDTPLGQKIHSLKIWALDGRLLYHPQTELIGRQFKPTSSLMQAIGGQVAAEFDEVAPGDEDFQEAKLNMALLEIYTPIKHQKQGNTIAIAEFYQEANELEERLDVTRINAWLIVIFAMLVAYGLQYSIVWRGNNIIHNQGKALNEQVFVLRDLLQKNNSLSRQLRLALNSNTENNEKLLSRISADLHDGPAQYMSLALLRLDALAEKKTNQSRGIIEELRKAISDSLTELRNISKGLALPNLESMTVQEIIKTAIKAHQHRTRSTVELQTKLGETDLHPDMPVKITLFRTLQEGLNNAYQHASGIGQNVKVHTDENQLLISIADRGMGFNLDTITKNEDHLGLNGLRERIKGLGGQFSMDSKIGEGTVLNVSLPLLEND